MNKRKLFVFMCSLSIAVTVTLLLFVNFIMPFFSCGYSKDEKQLVNDLFTHNLLASEVDAIQFGLSNNEIMIKLAHEDFSTFLNMVSQNRPSSVARLGRYTPVLTIRRLDGTEVDFEFYESGDYVIMGASCLRYEQGNWSIGAGEVYDWLLAMTK